MFPQFGCFWRICWTGDLGKHWIAWYFWSAISRPRDWSIEGINAQLESKRSKCFIGASLGPNEPFCSEKFTSENGHFWFERIVINEQSLGIIEQKFQQLSVLWRSIERFYLDFYRIFFQWFFEEIWFWAWSDIDGCSQDKAPYGNSNTPDLF